MMTLDTPAEQVEAEPAPVILVFGLRAQKRGAEGLPTSSVCTRRAFGVIWRIARIAKAVP